MKLSQKKNCNGCKCSFYDTRPISHYCELGCKVEEGDYEGIPQEPCYKPLTNSKWIEARKLIGL